MARTANAITQATQSSDRDIAEIPGAASTKSKPTKVTSQAVNFAIFLPPFTNLLIVYRGFSAI